MLKLASKLTYKWRQYRYLNDCSRSKAWQTKKSKQNKTNIQLLFLTPPCSGRSPPNFFMKTEDIGTIFAPPSLIFTALHGMQSRYSDGNSVCPSVCLSVRQTRALWQNGRKLCFDFYIIWKNIYSSFLRRRMVGGGWHLLPEILGQPARVGAKSPILNR